MNLSNDLRENGFCVLRGAFDAVAVDAMRSTVMANLDRMANTRSNSNSRHIAGFHRFPTLEPLHQMMTSNQTVSAALTAFYAPAQFTTIGLSDITVNRSQPWHTDLLRGEYARFLSPDICWGDVGGGCLKALLYLQTGRSLKVLPGSHLIPVSLSGDGAVVPEDTRAVQSVPVSVGDILLMDIRLVHRGSTDDEMQASTIEDTPKILVSTVFGAQGAALTQAMHLGNAHRMTDWDARHLSGAMQG